MSDHAMTTQRPATQDTERHLVHVKISTPEGALPEDQGAEDHTIEVIFNAPEGVTEAEDTEGQMMTARDPLRRGSASSPGPPSSTCMASSMRRAKMR